MKFLKTLFLAAFLFNASIATFAAEKEITVGFKPFSEQLILAEMAKQLLEEKGYKVDLKGNIQTPLLRQAQESGEVDLYFEYTGTAYITIHKQKDFEIYSDVQKCYDWVKEYDAKKGLVWLDMFQFNNTNSIMMRKTDSDTYNIHTLSDLSNHIKSNKEPKIKLAVSAEFFARKDGFKGLAKKYQFPRRFDLIKMDFGLIYKALYDKSIDAGLGYSTDGRIANWGFVNLVDDKNYFPVYYPAAVVRQDTLEANPDIDEILKPMSEKLTSDQIMKMNAAVDIHNEKPADVARKWIESIR